MMVEMVFILNTIFSSVIIPILLGLSFPGNFSFISAFDTDYFCLKSIKSSVDDPSNNLLQWNFNDEIFICTFPGVSCWHDTDSKVFSLNLPDLGLKGQFPQGIQNCTSLSHLNLSRNELSGPIPVDIWPKLKFLTTLDLSGNYFSGLIPPSLASCEYLVVLRLNNNRLVGSIPSQFGFMNRIMNFSVANNKLTGPVPNFTESTDIELNYENNPGLCVHPLKSCADASYSDTDFFVSGFVTGSGISMISVLFVCLFGCKSISLKKMNTKRYKKAKLAVYGIALRSRTTNTNSSQMIANLDKYVARISFAELNIATATLSQENIIGSGKMGTLYKTALPFGYFLAIKSLNSEQWCVEIISELMSLGRIRHRRLVPLIGFCNEMQDTLILYKYMSNGNLYDRLHPKNGEGSIMEWRLRAKIAIGTAEGLAWLHNNCNFRVVHNSITSQCILLDKNFEPNISNFWKAKITWSDHTVSSWNSFPTDQSLELDFDKKDVYYFGVVLLELLTGKTPEELAKFIEHFCDSSFFHESSCLFEVDEILMEQGFDDEIIQFFEIAKKCLRSNPDQRPSMLQVYETLTSFGQIHNYISDDEMLINCLSCQSAGLVKFAN